MISIYKISWMLRIWIYIFYIWMFHLSIYACFHISIYECFIFGCMNVFFISYMHDQYLDIRMFKFDNNRSIWKFTSTPSITVHVSIYKVCGVLPLQRHTSPFSGRFFISFIITYNLLSLLSSWESYIFWLFMHRPFLCGLLFLMFFSLFHIPKYDAIGQRHQSIHTPEQ